MSRPEDDFCFASQDDRPIPYLDRVRSYYLALGYSPPYAWAHYRDVPFTPLKKPLSETIVTIVTTATPIVTGKGPQGPNTPYNVLPRSYQVYALDSAEDHALAINHVAIDFKHTTAEDPNTYLPLPALRRAAASGRLRLAPRMHGLPTNRSHRVTIGIDAPALVAAVKADGADAALLVPNCPVCHQSVSIAARQLEAAGIATVVMGCARDIVEHVGVPRLLFSDFPLGNAAGRPNDRASQDATLDLALALLASAPASRTTVQSPLRWSDDWSWKLDYSNAERLTPAEIAGKRAEFDRQLDIARGMRTELGLSRTVPSPRERGEGEGEGRECA